MERYIGLDVHATSSTFAVVSEKGKRLSSAVVETNGQSLVQYLKTIAGRRHLCVEEGTQSQWLYEVLSPHIDQMVVTQVTESRGQKDDLSDAFKRAEELRVGSVHPVFKDVRGLGKLRSLADVYTKVSADRVRVQLRLKALYRGRGVQAPDKTVYTLKHREKWMKMLPVAYRPSAELMYAQLDALGEVKKKLASSWFTNHTHMRSRECSKRFLGLAKYEWLS